MCLDDQGGMLHSDYDIGDDLLTNVFHSGCSTLLKTLAGEMNGIYLDDASHLNYQGMDVAFWSTLGLAH